MPHKWTDEEKSKQADAIRQWQPWKNSTGPRSASGKERSKMNARKDGENSAPMRKLRKILHNQIQWLKSLR